MHRPIPGGFLIAIEGIDGAGKTTQVDLLAAACARLNMACVVSKEPTEGPYGRQARQMGITGRLGLDKELELFTLDRHQHVAEVIQPALETGAVVILDRYYFSTAAYQGALGADPAAILRENEAFAPPADMLVIVDVTCEVGLARIQKRGDRPNLFEKTEMLDRAREIFQTIGHPRLVRINGLLPSEKIHETLVERFQLAAVDKIARHGGLTRENTSRTLQVFGQQALA